MQRKNNQTLTADGVPYPALTAKTPALGVGCATLWQTSPQAKTPGQLTDSKVDRTHMNPPLSVSVASESDNPVVRNHDGADAYHRPITTRPCGENNAYIGAPDRFVEGDRRAALGNQRSSAVSSRHVQHFFSVQHFNAFLLHHTSDQPLHVGIMGRKQ